MFSHPWTKNVAVFWMLLKIQASFWFTNYINLVIGLGVALYTMVCWLAFKEGDPFLLVSGISVGILRNGMIIYTTNLIEWKTTSTNKKFSLTPISPTLMAGAIVFFNFLTTLGVALIMFIVAVGFFPGQRELLGHANGWVVISAFLLVWLTSMAIGLVCYKFIPSLVYARMMMLLIYTLTVYLLGLGFPIDTILATAWLGGVLYAFPHRFAINLAQAGFANYHGTDGRGSILKIQEMPIYGHSGEQIKTLSVDFGYQGHLWLAYLLAILVVIIYFAIPVAKIFYEASFHHRTAYGKLVINQTSARYIHNLKLARDFAQVQLLYKARIAELLDRTPELGPTINQVAQEVKLREKIAQKKAGESEESLV